MFKFKFNIIKNFKIRTDTDTFISLFSDCYFLFDYCIKAIFKIKSIKVAKIYNFV